MKSTILLSSNTLLSLICLTFYLSISFAQFFDFPKNEYDYSIKREALLEAELKFEEPVAALDQDEQVVDHYLQNLKWEEFLRNGMSGFPPAMPTEQIMDVVTESELYEAIRRLPKGGSLHTHESHHVSKAVLLDIIWASEDFEYLYILPETHAQYPWMLDFFLNPPDETPAWINVKNNTNYTKEDILEHQTLVGLLDDEAKQRPSDSAKRWQLINQLWLRGSSQLVANINIKRKYLETFYRLGMEEGIMYFEARKNFYYGERLYELNPDPAYQSTGGKHYLDDEGYGDFDINVTLAAVAQYQSENDKFIGHRRITYTQRQTPPDQVLSEINNAIRLHEKYPNHLIGYDIVGEEDAGNSHIFYLKQFLELYDGLTTRPKIPLYMHTAETSWPEDLITSVNDLDPLATIQNAYEAVILNSQRIGHGLGFIKHPYLLSVLRDRGIAVEVCVVSNNLLGIIPDIRNHPAQNYFRNGIPIVLGPDDPGTMGYNNITLDWYQAFLGWGLNLADLKTIAVNSLNYTSLSSTEKTDAINKWQSLWNQYINEMKTTACAQNYSTSSSPPSFATILPHEGAINNRNKVHIFGRNFQLGICRDVACKFGDSPSPKTMYVSNNHLICETPDIATQMKMHSKLTKPSSVTVEVLVTFDGENFLSTGENFTYIYEIITSPSTTQKIINLATTKERSKLSTFGTAIINVLVVLLIKRQ